MIDINNLKEEILPLISNANSLETLDEVRVQALGKKGKITSLMKTLGKMDPEERKTTGQALNVLKDEIADLIAAQEKMLKNQLLADRLATETIDVSLTPRPERPKMTGITLPR